jgi:hypothetical protein
VRRKGTFGRPFMADSATPYIFARHRGDDRQGDLSPNEKETSQPARAVSTAPNLTADQELGLYWDIDHSPWVDPDERQLFRAAVSTKQGRPNCPTR